MNKKLLTIYSIFTLLLVGLMSFKTQNRWRAPDEAKLIKNPVIVADREDSAKRGKRIFKTRCMVCHGSTGVGNGVGGKTLDPKPQNLTLPMVKNQTDGEIFWKVSNGRNAMVKWEPILSEDERWDVVNYVRTLQEDDI